MTIINPVIIAYHYHGSTTLKHFCNFIIRYKICYKLGFNHHRNSIWLKLLHDRPHLVIREGHKDIKVNDDIPGDRMAAALQRTLQNKLDETILAEHFFRRENLVNLEKKCSVKIKDRICSAEVVIRSAFNLTYQCT